MDDFDKGLMIRTLEVVEESAKGQRTVVLIDLVVSLVMPVVLILVFMGLELPFFVEVIAPLIIFVGGLSATLFLQRIFSKQIGPIALYSNGLDFPSAWIDRLLRKSSFLSKEDISSMSVREPKGDSRFVNKPFAIFTVTDRKGKPYFAGMRDKTDVQATKEYAKKEWGTRIEGETMAVNPSSRNGKGAKARKIPSHQGPPSYRLFCTGCGATLGSDFEYCPICGSYQGGRP